MIWDLAGKDEFSSVRKSYLRGANGFLYVVDGTRKETLEAASEEMSVIAGEFPEAASMLLVNKHDLTDEWELGDSDLGPFSEGGMPICFTSAKTGENVEEAFRDLAAAMLAAGRDPSVT